MSAGRDYNLHACTPNGAQRLLLRVALGDDDGALEAWREWRQTQDIDAIDSASFRLLPLIYLRLKVLAPGDPLLARLQVVYRHTWFKNQLLVNQAQQAADALEAAGIDTMLLKGGALSITRYTDPGARHMNDIDLMVRPADFEPAMQLLLANNWNLQGTTPTRIATARRRGFIHGCGFTLGEAEIDLHAQLSRFVWQDDERVWGTSQQVQWGKLRVRVLAPTLALYHTCVHGVRWSHAILTWIPDAMALLEQERDALDWDLLVNLSRQSRTVCQVWNALAFLAGEYGAPIPARLLQQLRESPTSWVERAEYRALAQRPGRGPLQLARRLWLRSCRFRQGGRQADGPIRLSALGWIPYLALYRLTPGN